MGSIFVSVVVDVTLEGLILLYLLYSCTDPFDHPIL